MLKYSVSIRWSDEDKGFIATVPELPGLSAFGTNQSEAFSELKTASHAYLKSLKESGMPVPAPEKVVTYSGQIRLRMPKEMHAALAESAEREGVSLNTYIVILLSKRNSKQEILRRIAELESSFRNFAYNLESSAANNAQSLNPSATIELATAVKCLDWRPN